MGAVLMWPFRKPETRATPNATDALVSALERQASGQIPDPAALAVAEAAAGLWERAIASATIAPMTPETEPLSPSMLALVARGLASRGEFLAVILVDEAMGLRLVPASGWDVRGGSDAATWFYRCDMAGPTRTESVSLPAAAVLHVRIGADPQTPWRGRAPLRRSRATAALAVALEGSLNRDARLPVGLVATVGTAVNTPEQIKEFGDSLSKGGLTVLHGRGYDGTGDISGRLKPQRYGPAPDTVSQALRTEIGREIASAFGVPPTLFNASGDGAGQREAWRRLWTGTVAPIGRVLEAEVRAKLAPGAKVSFEALRASDEDGRSRAVSRRATAFKIFMEAGMGRDEAMRRAGVRDAA